MSEEKFQFTFVNNVADNVLGILNGQRLTFEDFNNLYPTFTDKMHFYQQNKADIEPIQLFELWLKTQFLNHILFETNAWQSLVQLEKQPQVESLVQLDKQPQVESLIHQESFHCINFVGEKNDFMTIFSKEDVNIISQVDFDAMFPSFKEIMDFYQNNEIKIQNLEMFQQWLRKKFLEIILFETNLWSWCLSLNYTEEKDETQKKE